LGIAADVLAVPRQMTAEHQRDFDRLLTRSIQDRVASGSREPQTEDDLAATRSELDRWIDKQTENEAAGTFDWELGRRINAAKRQFSADSIDSELHNPAWCRERGCPATACIEARRLPKSSLNPAGPTGTVRAHRVDPSAVWASSQATSRRWWRSTKS
jgi:hypothetical protein